MKSLNSYRNFMGKGIVGMLGRIKRKVMVSTTDIHTNKGLKKTQK